MLPKSGGVFYIYFSVDKANIVSSARKIRQSERVIQIDISGVSFCAVWRCDSNNSHANRQIISDTSKVKYN